jgi:hypothetical protein
MNTLHMHFFTFTKSELFFDNMTRIRAAQNGKQCIKIDKIGVQNHIAMIDRVKLESLKWIFRIVDTAFLPNSHSLTKIRHVQYSSPTRFCHDQGRLYVFKKWTQFLLGLPIVMFGKPFILITYILPAVHILHTTTVWNDALVLHSNCLHT